MVDDKHNEERIIFDELTVLPKVKQPETLTEQEIEDGITKQATKNVADFGNIHTGDRASMDDIVSGRYIPDGAVLTTLATGEYVLENSANEIIARLGVTEDASTYVPVGLDATLLDTFDSSEW